MERFEACFGIYLNELQALNFDHGKIRNLFLIIGISLNPNQSIQI
jgi:hypothetical protein